MEFSRRLESDRKKSVAMRRTAGNEAIRKRIAELRSCWEWDLTAKTG